MISIHLDRVADIALSEPEKDPKKESSIKREIKGGIKIENLATLLFDVVGWKPHHLDKKLSPPGSVKRRLANCEKLKTLVGWKPEIILEDGLRMTYEWYLKNPGPQ